MGVKDLLFEESESGHDLPFVRKTILIIHYFHHYSMINKSEIYLLWTVLNKPPQTADQKEKTQTTNALSLNFKIYCLNRLSTMV